MSTSDITGDIPINFRVFRIESRWSEDGVDYWDFLSKEDAIAWADSPQAATVILTEEGRDDNVSIRELSKEEIIQTALPFYKDALETFFHNE